MVFSGLEEKTYTKKVQEERLGIWYFHKVFMLQDERYKRDHHALEDIREDKGLTS